MLSSDPSFKPNPPPTKVPLGPVGPGNPGNPGNPAPTPATPSSTTAVPAEKPVTIPVDPAKVQTAPPTSTGSSAAIPLPPPPPPPPPPRRFRRLRLLLYFILFGALTYGGAVFYALRSDNFHDFFTEYIPFGEDAVLFFEERSFQKRFPNAKPHMHRSGATVPAGNDKKVTIPLKSGLSWKAVEEEPKGGSDLTQKGRHMSALDANKPKPKEDVKKAQQAPSSATPKEASAAVQAAKKDSPTPDQHPSRPSTKKEEPKPARAAPVPPSSVTPSPKSDPRPPVIPPVSSISNVQVPNAEEPVVQELVKIMNDLITVVNADTTEVTNKYSAPMNKAKESLVAVAGKIKALRDAERSAAEDRVQEAHKEFDDGAKRLMKRIETVQQEEDAKYREEFEAERARLASNYDSKLKSEIERSNAVAEQRMRNELTEQAIEMKRKFVSQIQSLVESERDGRLSKLSDLSTNLDSLTQLTSNWNGVIDSNLATQKLQVAVDSVRAALASSSHADSKPTPFVREMAALKLTADGDAIVDAAIASINPNAYQKGIPSQPQLIDRFRRVASEVRKASLLPEDAGIASHATSFLLSKVMFKKQGQPQGGDVESILTRTETMLEEGDLDGAAREMNGLQGWAKVLSRDWMGDVRKVLEVKQALDVMETEARLQCLRVE